MKFGVSYYPELVDESEWKTDLSRMRSAGLTVIRMLDFAWSAIEPREGVYRWDWLDRFLDLAREQSFEILACTPTAAPPAWLVQQYPDIMAVLPGGERRTFGGRRDVSMCSTIYRDYAAQLARTLGQRYGRHPAVIGWQIDNELMGPEFAPMEDHHPEANWRFRRWLQGRYADLQAINQAWGMRFWSQEFSAWGEITTPLNRRCCLGWKLDYARFLTDMNAEFLRIQAEALRAIVEPRQFITHNSTATLDRGIDHRCYARVQDETGWDAYRGAASPTLPEAATAMVHDLFRGFLGKSFWVFETNPGTLPFTQAYVAEMHAHGAKGVLYWHWRQHRGNVEQGCLAVCDFAGRPVPSRLQAIERAAQRPEFQPILPERMPKAEAAILFAPDGVRADPTSSDYLQAVIKLYAAFRQLGVALDVVYPGDDLRDYRMVAAPALKLLGRSEAALITRFVLDGGILLGVGPLAMMDLHGVYHPVPGEPLADALGFTFQGPLRVTEKPDIVLDDGQRFAAESTVESLALGSATVEGRFAGGDFDGAPAVTRNQLGKGWTYYAACTCRPLNLELARRALTAAGLKFVDQPHEEVAVYPDPTGRGTWLFNYSATPRTVLGVEVPAGDFRLLSGEACKNGRDRARPSRRRSKRPVLPLV